MKVIGLAGEAGCGKSVVAQELAKREGIAWVNLDEVAWETYRPRSPVYWRLVSRFGEEILDPSGTIDRPRLSKIVFSDERALANLNAIVHPAVTDRLRRIIADEKARGTKVLLVEGALLGSSQHVDRSLFDAILWLAASEEMRRRRLGKAGRVHHLGRTSPRPENEGIVLIDAEGSLAQVVARVATAIENL